MWVAMAVAAGGCSDGGTGPDTELSLSMVVGSYTAEGSFGAVVLTTHDPDGEGPVDWLARGASILLGLHEDLTTTGRMFVPGGDEDGGDLDMDLAGTWSLDGNVVRLQHDADTFLRDMDLVVGNDRLRGEETFGDVTIQLEMQRR
jgi:hypothetical protein